MPLVNALTEAGGINPVHMGVVLIATLAFGADHAAIRDRAVDGVKIRRCTIFAGVAGRVSDLCRLFHDDRIFASISAGRARAAEAGSSGLGRLFPKSERPGIYLST